MREPRQIDLRGSVSTISDELVFLQQHTGRDESVILVEALHTGLHALYYQTVEQLFIDEELSREQAAEILGLERIRELEYAKKALEQDVRQGLAL